MPQVPRYDAPTVSPEALPSPRVSDNAPLNDFGGGDLTQVAQSAKGLTGAVMDIYDQEKEKADQVAVLDAHNKAQKLATDLLYNPQTGAMAKQGKDAMGTPDYVAAKWQDGVSQITDNLSNPAQKAAFNHLAGKIYGSLNEQVQSHVVDQTKKYDTAVTDSSVSNAQNTVSFNPTLKTAATAIDTQKAALTLYAQRNGLPDSWLQDKLAQSTSDTHVIAINRLLDNGQPRTALAYYDATKGQILGTEYDRISKQIADQTLLARAQDGAASLIGSNTNSSNGGISFDTARIADGIDAISDPDLRAETRRQVDLRMRAQENAINNNEAHAATLVANNQMTQSWLDQNKDSISDGTYKTAQFAMHHFGSPDASDAVQSATMQSLLDQFSKIGQGDIYTQTQRMIQYRRDVMANVQKLPADVFTQLLSYSDPKYVPPPEKQGMFSAAYDAVKNAMSRIGADAGPALLQLVKKAADPSAAPQDIPGMAQSIVRGSVYEKNPSLIMKSDLSNNVVNQKTGPRQASTATSKLKPDQTISVPSAQFKPGDEQPKNGVTYVRQADGKWLPKNKL